MKLNRWWTNFIHGCPSKGLIKTIVCLWHVTYEETAIGYHRQSGTLGRGVNLYCVLVPSNATNRYMAVNCNICSCIGFDYWRKSPLERWKGWNVKWSVWWELYRFILRRLTTQQHLYTVNLPISARGAYFKCRRRWGGEQGCRSAARTLTSHQCGSSSIPTWCHMCGWVCC